MVPALGGAELSESGFVLACESNAVRDRGMKFHEDSAVDSTSGEAFDDVTNVFRAAVFGRKQARVAGDENTFHGRPPLTRRLATTQGI